MRAAGVMFAENLDMRAGQCLMLALRELDRDAYILITGTAADCFYNDNRVGAFWARLEEVEHE